MLPPKVRAVFAKELRDALRDRRTVLATVVIPILLYPVMLLGMAQMVLVARAKLDREVYTVAVPAGTGEFFRGMAAAHGTNGSGEDSDAAAVDAKLDKNAPAPTLVFKELPADEARMALAAGELHLVISLPPDFQERLQAENPQPVSVDVQFDQAEHRSIDASKRLATLFDRKGKQILEERLKAKDLTRRMLQAFEIKTLNVAQASKVGGSVIGTMLPLLFIMMVIAGSMGPAVDMTAGEKERSTLETLIGAPVRPIEIISGKFLAVATLAMGNAALNVASFAASFALMPMPKVQEMAFPWSALPLTLLLLLPLALFFAGLLLAVCSFAANQKEAQIYCLPVYLIPMVGMMMVTMPGIDLEGPLLLIPVVNTVLLIKELFLYHGTAQQVIFVFCSSCLYAAGTVALAARIFAREEVLFSAQGSLRLFLKRRFFTPALLPGPGDALLLVALLFPLNFWVQTGLARALSDANTGSISPGGMAALLLIPQFVLFLGTPILLTWYLKVNTKETFLWRIPRLRDIVSGVLVGAAGMIVVRQMIAWQSALWPFPPEVNDPLTKSLGEIAAMPGGLVWVVLLMGATPGLCEEHLFRGFMLQGLRGAGKWLSILVVGIVFGAYHIMVYKQPVLMFMGVVLSFLAFQTRSIWTAVLCHAIYNSMAVLMPAVFGDQEAAASSGVYPSIEPKYLIPAVLAFVFGLWLVRKGVADPQPAPADAPAQATPQESSIVNPES